MDNPQTKNNTKKLPFNALILISQYLSRPYSFEDVKISTNPTLSIKTDIERDISNPKKKKIKRTTTFKARKTFEHAYSLDTSYLLEDGSSVNISRISDTYHTKNTYLSEKPSYDNISIFNRQHMLSEAVVRIQRFWRKRKGKGAKKVSIQPVTFTKKVVYRELFKKVILLQRYIRSFLEKCKRKSLTKLLLKAFRRIEYENEDKQKSKNVMKKSGLKKVIIALILAY
jgi:hypothetical protein